MKYDAATYQMTEKGKIGLIGLVLGVIGLALTAYSFSQDAYHTYFAYLVSFFFWLSISLGGLFFTMLHHLTRATWSVVLRKISEALMMTLPLMALFFIPIIFGIHDLFHWSHADAVAADPILQKKEAFLNVPFFLIRAVAYFAIWIGVAFYLRSISNRQDRAHSDKMLFNARKISAPAMILFAVTITLASVDWLMSLDPHWFSTIFGVYLFSGAFLAFLSTMILIMVCHKRNDVLTGVITTEHRHDVAKFTFGFIIFWTYMAFSQYFLIWYANIPEETYWFLKRWEGHWQTISLIVIFGHFVFPFLALITRAAKRSAIWMAFMALWILAMRWVDLYWIAFPSSHDGGMHIPGITWVGVIGSMMAIGGFFVWFFWSQYTSKPLVPVNDPRLPGSIKFVNN